MNIRKAIAVHRNSRRFGKRQLRLSLAYSYCESRKHNREAELCSRQAEDAVRRYRVGNGHGIFYRFADTTHLVTNWHNVTGRHPLTNAPLRKEGGVPDRMVIGFPHRIQKEDHHHAIMWQWRVIRLYEDNEMHCPTWYEHPTFQQRVDVVTMPISELEIIAVLPANDSALDLALPGYTLVWMFSFLDSRRE